MSGKIVITGGGTGGHLKVAKAFIDELAVNRNSKPIFIGSLNGQDKRWFEDYKNLEKAYFLNTKGVVNKGLFGKIKALGQIFFQTLKCCVYFIKNDVKSVISVGGFSAAPATFASIVIPSCKLYIHEQNSYMGRLNKLTSKFAVEVFSSYLEESKIKDYPVSSEFFLNSRIRTEVKKVIFLGGSQGAVALNSFAISVAKDLDDMGIKIIHQTGDRDFLRVKSEYEKLGLDVDVFDFTNELIEKMKEADFAISRSGASTLWELVANGLPTLFVPFPFAAQDHQYGNAKFLKEKKLAFLVREKELNKDILFEAINSDIKSISENLSTLISNDAIKKIIDFILSKN
ncbi:UDP-N-acetylglucosamine--N-acetylmuramyl-(pentapeptide) pyrophosphoryl-undecaprenol N-acetylglucosamine transferase [Arcobacter sp. KX21116]|jgi:UDP-N-acetylglucosamine--N-acetylmuramyl-(pentapeptide) pyrophosphoryl-undecaprenol N-acetylglucosamine transferase|uniref:UDP-N-acetylglucosamine--N-acetylmuramyl- (pentapeptide) pyrophosphoryl-undecaprenol N-acetylglucosamine transferase n=1 Tax=Arcobacter iocasae TaxID=2906515 RepID=UPI0035D52421